MYYYVKLAIPDSARDVGHGLLHSHNDTAESTRLAKPRARKRNRAEDAVTSELLRLLRQKNSNETMTTTTTTAAEKRRHKMKQLLSELKEILKTIKDMADDDDKKFFEWEADQLRSELTNLRAEMS